MTKKRLVFYQVYLMAASDCSPARLLCAREDGFYFEGKSDFILNSFSLGKLYITIIWYNILYCIY